MISEKKMQQVVENLKDGVLPTFLNNNTPEEIDAETNIFLHIAYLTALKKGLDAEIEACKSFVEQRLPESKTENRYFSISFVKPSKSIALTKEAKEFVKKEYADKEEFFKVTEKTGYFTWK